MTEYAIGDRVRIRADRAHGLIQPYRKWAEQGRLGTVIRLPERTPSDVQVRFDTARPPKFPADYVVRMHLKDIEKVTP